jgi:hypothetical protein
VAIDSNAPRSRRAVLGAALGGVGALAVHSLAKPGSASAASGDTLILGQANDAEADSTSLTSSVDGVALDISTTTSGGTGARAFTGDGTDLAGDTTFTGLYGFAEDADNFTAAGVWGDTATGTGVVGSGFTGVYGTGVFGTMGDVDGASIGVYGFAGDETAPDPGLGANVGVAMVGRAGTSATYGVVGVGPGTTQWAVYVAGRLRLSSRSGGVKSIGASATSLKVTLAGVTSSTLVVATLQTSVSGCYVRAVVPTTGSFTIYLSKAPGKTVKVGYIIAN